MNDPDGRRGDVAEWVRYLRDIGVRELSVPAVSPTRRTGSRAARGTERGANAASAPAARRRAIDREPVADPTPSRVEASPRVQAGLPLLSAEPAPSDPAAALAEIRDDLGECTRCKLHEGRRKIVFGVGNPRAKLMFVGEGPGAEEDARGEPFVGRAGKKLDEMIAAIGLERSEVYIANIVKCRPPDNRDPQPDEVATCSPFLRRQIAAIRPRAIVALGSPAAKTLLDTRVGITKLRGQWHSFAGIPVMPTFHPAYLLRAYTAENRRKVWNDLKAARARVDESP